MFSKILVPLDGSSEAEKALDFALETLSKRGGGELVMLRVLEVPSVSIQTSLELLDARQTEKGAVDDYMHALSQKNLPAGVTAEVVVCNGPSAAQSIVKTAEEHHVKAVFMTSHGRSGLGRFLMGSVAEKVLRTSNCPILIVR